MKTIRVTNQKEFNAIPKDCSELACVDIYSSEKITISKNIKNCIYRLFDSSRAVLRDSSSARLYDSSSAVLCDSSSARLCDSSRAVLRDSSSARLYDSSSAMLHGSSRAVLYDSSSAELCDSSSAVLYDSSRAELCDSSSAVLYDSSRAELFSRSLVRVYSEDSRINAYEVSTVLEHTKNKNIKLHDNATRSLVGTVPVVSFETWIKRGYVVADGIYQKYKSHKKIEGVTVYETDSGFVAYKSKKFAHGETENEAIIDLKFKLSKRDTSTYMKWKIDDKKPVTEMIIAYRVITGACSQGVRNFCKSIKLQDEYSPMEVIEVTKGNYGHEEFKKFFKREGE